MPEDANQIRHIFLNLKISTSCRKCLTFPNLKTRNIIDSVETTAEPHLSLKRLRGRRGGEEWGEKGEWWSGGVVGLGGRGKRGSGGKELISLSEDVKRLNGSSVTDFLAFRQTIRLLDNIRKFA